MSTITTHVLDTSLGRPAAGVSVSLESVRANGTGAQIGAGMTNDDGRITDLLAPGMRAEPGEYRLRFETGAYFARDGREAFYPVVHITFRITAGNAHYHVPLLLNPFGFSTYRGS